MTRQHLTYLLHPVFLTGLFLLILNDHYLKAAYGNWWTGKLSDFAGVLLLPLFWKAVVGGRDRTALLMTALFFTWWKLPLSQPVIDGAAALTGIGFGRVVDATDLIALTVLPLSAWALRTPVILGLTGRKWTPRTNTQRLVAGGLVLPVALLALVATSAPDDDIYILDGNTTDCCTDTPAQLTTEAGTLYLPSAFSPDFDGINDVLQIIPDGGPFTVDTFRVITPEDDRVVYEAVNVTSFAPADGFDGVVNDTIEPRQFYYIIQLSSPMGRQRAEGAVCSLPCAEPSGVSRPTNLDNCRYGTQFVPGQGFSADLDSFEDYTDCFD